MPLEFIPDATDVGPTSRNRHLITFGNVKVGYLNQVGPGFPHSGQWTYHMGYRADGEGSNGMNATRAEAEAECQAMWQRWLTWAGLEERAT